MRSAPFFSSLLCAILHCTALHCTARLSSPHISISPPSLSLFFLFLYLHPSHTTRSYLCCALRFAPLFGKILYTLGFFAPELSILRLLVEEDSDAPAAPGLACLGLFGSLLAGQAERAGRKGRVGRELPR